VRRTYSWVDETLLLAIVLVEQIVRVARELVTACSAGLDELGAASVCWVGD